jgi:hypothetical protein
VQSRTTKITMPSYFKPLRRKFGVLTLVIACVFAAGWIRKTLVVDSICGRIWPETLVGLASSPEGFSAAIGRANRDYTDELPLWSNYPVDQNHISIFDDERYVWRWKFQSFGYGYASDPSLHLATKVVCFPHWSLVLPLTAISAWLLLSKPRSKKTPEKHGLTE